MPCGGGDGGSNTVLTAPRLKRNRVVSNGRIKERRRGLSMQWRRETAMALHSRPKLVAAVMGDG